MKIRFLPSLILIAVLVVAFTPVTSTSAPAQPVSIYTSAMPPSVTATAGPVLPATTSPAETIAPTPFPIVTSRGPHLEATDPKTVSMASAGLQFVEFFEFW